MPARSGFWSYVHDDDHVEQGRIKQLADDLRDQFALMSGESIEIFVDRNNIAWGDNWRDKIDISLGAGSFFIPVITPRFFQSQECRRELQTFVRSATNLGVRELILPLVYVNVNALNEESPDDEAVALVKTFQWMDWRDIRFKKRKSGAYRRGVADLAQRLIDASSQAAGEPEAPVSSAPSIPPAKDGVPPAKDGDEPGTLDDLARGEQAMPKLASAINEMGEEIIKIGDLAQKAATDIRVSDEQGNGFSGRLVITNKLAQDLSAPAERIVNLANTYTTSIYDADRALTAVIRMAPAEVAANPSVKVAWDGFYQMITQLASATNAGVASVKALSESLESVESMSRYLRVPAQEIRRGLTIFTEGSTVINEWKRMADEASAEIESK